LIRVQPLRLEKMLLLKTMAAGDFQEPRIAIRDGSHLAHANYGKNRIRVTGRGSTFDGVNLVEDAGLREG
jgi:hypothetical protein